MSELFQRDGAVALQNEDGITTRPMANWAPKVVAEVKSDDVFEGVLIEHPSRGTKEEMRK